MKVLKQIFFVLAFLSFLFSHSQNQKIESLLTQLKVLRHDTSYANTLNALCREYESIRNIRALDSLSSISLSVSKELNFKKGEAFAYAHQGYANFGLSNYWEGVEKSQKALEIFEGLGMEFETAKVLNTIGLNYSEQGDYAKSLEYFFRSLSINEKLKDKESISASYGNIGNVYTYRNDNDKALEYYLKSVRLNYQIGKTDLNAGNFHNIAIIYAAKGKEKAGANKIDEAADQYLKAQQYYEKASVINARTGNKMWLSKNLVGLGTVNIFENEFDSAHKNFDRALKLSEDVGSKNGIINARIKIAELYTRENKYKESDENYQLALAMAKEINSIPLLRNIYQRLCYLSSMKEDNKNAVLYMREAVAYKDSLFNQSKRQEMTRAEMNYEFSKKEAANKAEHDKKEAVVNAEKRKQRIVLVLICIALLLVFGFSLLLYRSLKTTRKQSDFIELKNQEAEYQKSIIEQKNKDILDSIKYARRIQLSLMPTERFLRRYLK